MPTAAETAFADADLARDLARIDLIVEQHRVHLGDDRLTMMDVEFLMAAAGEFAVSVRHAYFRARDLGLLSWQVAEADAGALRPGSPEEAARVAEIVAGAPTQQTGEWPR